MAYENLENSLRSMVENESRKRDSKLSEDISKEFSRLAAINLLSSGVAVTSATELCNTDLKERINFIYEKIKIIVDSKNISYKDELGKKANDLLKELSETAKNECSGFCSVAVIKINAGSVKRSLQQIDHKFQLEIKEVLNEMGVYFDELKNKTSPGFKRWIKSHGTIIAIAAITAVITGLIGKFF